MADTYTDEQLIKDFIEGSQLAFREVFDRYHDKIFFTCARITKNKQEAQDITLVVLQKLFQKHKDFDNLAQLGSYLYVSARNRSINYLRDMKLDLQRKAAFRHSLYLDEEAFQAELDAEYLSMIIKGMENLSERARQVLRLRYMENLKNHEIAEALGISANTVKNHLAQSIDKLKKSVNGKPVSELTIIALVTLLYN